MRRSTKQVSIDLAKYKDADNRKGRDSESEEENEADMFAAARYDSKTTWSEGGKGKDKVLNTIISRFSMLIHKNDVNHDNFEEVPVEEMYSKLPTVIKSLTKLIL
jgi:hypothetical protein